MTSEHEILWGKIQAFEFNEPGAAFTFEERLARDNGWSLTYAQRVIEEYRRFAFLAMTARHGVTPSEDVDQAWHLHLLYTVNYWEKWCGQALERPLHHNPTQGGQAEDAKHDDWYRHTLSSYTAAFGRSAPQDIWPLSEERFHAQKHREMPKCTKPSSGVRTSAIRRFFRELIERWMIVVQVSGPGCGSGVCSAAGHHGPHHHHGSSHGSDDSHGSQHGCSAGHGSHHSCGSHGCGGGH